jgi:hypothetical protein
MTVAATLGYYWGSDPREQAIDYASAHYDEFIVTYPPTPDVKTAKRACAYAMMAQTQDVPLGLIGGLAAMPERQAIFDECMRVHGYSQVH